MMRGRGVPSMDTHIWTDTHGPLCHACLATRRRTAHKWFIPNGVEGLGEAHEERRGSASAPQPHTAHAFMPAVRRDALYTHGMFTCQRIRRSRALSGRGHGHAPRAPDPATTSAVGGPRHPHHTRSRDQGTRRPLVPSVLLVLPLCLATSWWCHGLTVVWSGKALPPCLHRYSRPRLGRSPSAPPPRPPPWRSPEPSPLEFPPPQR